MTFAPRNTATSIAAGRGHTCALTSGSGVKCWGWNHYGQLGDGTTIDHITPADVSGLTSGVSAIGAGDAHTCALTTSDGVKCWGWNSSGQLGDGTTTWRTTPVDVSGMTSGVSAITVGWLHTCALTTSGDVKCWGYNTYGELGIGSADYNAHPIPLDVSGLTSGVSAIAAGYYHTCALTTSGGVKCWGWNDNGQLGDGTTTTRTTPVDVVGLTSGVSAIAAGWQHTCAVTTSGGVKCWGYNTYGELGDGTTTQRTTSVDASGLTSGVSSIVAGGGHTCAVTTSGGVKCWGDNGRGQLGDGTTTQRTTPVDASGLTSEVSAIAAGYGYTCAMTTSGGVKCWGWNYYGQLGDGTTADRHTPVDVVGFGGVPPPFLDLPFTYSNFSQSAQGNVNGNGGRVNSWFDHALPRYGQPNGILTRWDGQSFHTQDRISVSDCVLGETCYDYHNGIDIRKNIDDETILAAAAGTVITPTVSGYGNAVMIDHRNGYATFYGHLKDNSIKVSIGTSVTQNQPIAIMGNTGPGSKGVHLHFGLYYDQNSAGWTEDEVVDPYGWSGAGADPWNVTSRYLWKYPISTQQTGGTSGTTITSPSTNARTIVPAGALTTTVTLELWDTPPVAAPSAQLRSSGGSFWLRVLEWLTGGGNRPTTRTTASSFAQPVTVSVTYGVTETQHLNVNQMTMYRWDETSSAWVILPTTVNTNLRQATAQTTEIGSFDLQAPLLCPTDTQEIDDNFYAARSISTSGSQANRLFDIAQDEDWVRFDADGGMRYAVQTSNLASGVDTIVQVYDLDGVTVLASDDNSGGGKASRLTWQAQMSGTYFIRVSRAAGGVYGCSATYQLSVSQSAPLFLPLIIK